MPPVASKARIWWPKSASSIRRLWCRFFHQGSGNWRCTAASEPGGNRRGTSNRASPCSTMRFRRPRFAARDRISSQSERRVSITSRSSSGCRSAWSSAKAPLPGPISSSSGAVRPKSRFQSGKTSCGSMQPVSMRRGKYPALPAISTYAFRGGPPGGALYVEAHEARISLDVRLDDLRGRRSRADPRAEHSRPERSGPEDERVDRHGKGERHAAGEGEPEVQERRGRADL